MYLETYPGELFLILFAVSLQQVDGDRCGKSRHCRAGRRECCRNETEHKEHSDYHGKQGKTVGSDRRGQIGEEFVALERLARETGERSVPKDAQTSGILIEQNTQRQKKQIDRQEGKTVGDNILLSLLQVLARQVLLHHVLVKARHGNGGEHARQKLFPEVARVVAVTEEPCLGHRTAGHSVPESRTVEPHRLADIEDAENHGQQQTESLQHIRPNQCLYAAAEGIEPYDKHRQGNVQPERNTKSFKQHQLHHQCREIHADTAAQEFGDEEKDRTHLVAVRPEAPVEIPVDAIEIETVVKGEKDVGHSEIARRETQYHLEVGELRCRHHTRYRYEGNARNTGADHGDGYSPPR